MSDLAWLYAGIIALVGVLCGALLCLYIQNKGYVDTDALLNAYLALPTPGARDQAREIVTIFGGLDADDQEQLYKMAKRLSKPTWSFLDDVAG